MEEMNMKHYLRTAACLVTAAIMSAGIGAFSCMAESVSVYCFYNASESDCFWTTDPEEKYALENPENGKKLYSYTGLGWQVDTEAGGGRVPVYRFYNDTTKDHFFTSSNEEKAAIEQSLRSGKDQYVYEGIAWYAYNGGSCPVYRFFDETNFNHYYTANENEMQTLIRNGNRFRYEGIGWFASGYGSNGGSGNGSAGISQLLTAASSASGGVSGSYGYQNSAAQAKSDQEIANLLDMAIQNVYDPYGGFSVWEYGHQVNPYECNNPGQRQPNANELWCYVGKSQGEMAIEIANVYVDIYTGNAVFELIDGAEYFIGSGFPRSLRLW